MAPGSTSKRKTATKRRSTSEGTRKRTTIKPSSSGAKSSLEDLCIDAFRSWRRKNGIKKPVRQDIAQFFTDACVADRFPRAMGWNAVWETLSPTV